MLVCSGGRGARTCVSGTRCRDNLQILKGEAAAIKEKDKDAAASLSLKTTFLVPTVLP